MASTGDAPEPHYRDASPQARLRRQWARLHTRRALRSSIKAPMVSFSFDDPARSATTLGADILGEAGINATFYLAAGLLGGHGPIGDYADWDDIAGLVGRGHEIGCHGFAHLDCAGRSRSQIIADVEANAAAFKEHGLPPARTYAYPFGEVTSIAKVALAPRFALLRGVRKGVIARGSDLNQAPGVPLEGDGAQATAAAWLERALRRRAWVIFYLHDIAEAPSPWGCTPGALTAIVRRVQLSGAETVTVARGLDRLAAGDPPPAHR